ncbi:MAG: hypothetical protein SOU13_08345 [Eubacteriales bacterium]|nr:hypothetical protein [Eubacteriales bacterium]
MKKWTCLLLSLILVFCAAGGALAETTKDETVYVLANAEGEAKRVIVSDWLTNPDGEKDLADATTLKDAKAVKGSAFLKDGVWYNADGADVYYQGDAEDALPVNLTVSYTLDGEAKTAAEMTGRSGRVTIRVACDVKETKDGVKVPFAALTAALLDNDVFTNIEVTNGRFLDDGDRTVVVGWALPGLQETLKLDAETVTLPEYVEISADAKNFEAPTTLTVVTNELFSAVDVDSIDATELTENINRLKDGMAQLKDGASRLADGVSALKDGAKTLADGATELKNGAEALKESANPLGDGVSQLNDGATALETGSAQLIEGLNTLTANNEALASGATKLFETVLGIANTQLSAAMENAPTLTIENYEETLTALLDACSEAGIDKQLHDQVEAVVNQNRAKIEEAVTAKVRETVAAQVEEAVRENVTAQVLAAMDMTPDTYKAAVESGALTDAQKNQIAAAVDAQMKSQEVKAVLAQQTEQTMGSDEIKATIEQNVNEQVEALTQQNMASKDVQARRAAALEQGQAAAASLTALKAQLDDYRTFYDGLNAYLAGTAQAANGASELKTGAAQLAAGTEELNGKVPALLEGIGSLSNGMNTLTENLPSLTDGVQQLLDGANELKDGLNTFDEEGVSKLVSLVEDDLADMLDRVKAALNAANAYTTYTSLGENMTGRVRFVWRTDANQK